MQMDPLEIRILSEHATMNGSLTVLVLYFSLYAQELLNCQPFGTFCIRCGVNLLQDRLCRSCHYEWQCNRSCSLLLLLYSRTVELPFKVICSVFEMVVFFLSPLPLDTSVAERTVREHSGAKDWDQFATGMTTVAKEVGLTTSFYILLFYPRFLPFQRFQQFQL